MKRLLIFLTILFALTVNAYATDVTISAVTIDGFSPTNIGNDRSIAVSTAGGSPTVTSAGLFTGVVGLSGFRVLIDGSAYTVASVSSTSTLTLTTNYSGTPGAQTMTLYKWVEMRVYADRAFQPLGSTQIVQPGTVGSGNFFRRFAASVVNNGSTDQLFIPQIILPATTDGLITNQAKYSFPFYRPGTTSQLEFFFCPSSRSSLVLPAATPTTWSAICTYNSPSAVVPPNNDAATRAELNQRLPSCTLNNGIYYSASGNVLSCLTFGSGLSVVGSTLTATGGGSGYSTVQEEGGSLTQRGLLNFIGTSVTCADNGGATRTDCSFDPDLNALASSAGTGISVRTAANTWNFRSLTAPAAGFTISNNDGVSGNPTFALANDLSALEGLGTTGLSARTAADTWAIRTLTQPAAGLTITNPGGVAGNPTFALANDLSALEGLGTTGLSARTAADTWALRTLTQPAAGLTISNPAGTAGDPTFALANDLAAVEGLSTTGIAARTASDTWTTRSLTQPAAGITISNNDGVSGNPTFALANDLNAVEGLSTTGMAARTASDTWTTRTVTGTSGQVTLTNGDAVSGNPTVSLPNTVFLGTAGGSPSAGQLKGPDASGSNTAGANLELAGGPGTGNAVPGRVVLKYPLIGASGSSVQSLSANIYPVDANMFTSGAGVTISNTTTETTLLDAGSSGSTKTIEAGISRVGRIYRITIGIFQLTTTGNPTGRLKVKVGSTTIADTTAVAFPTANLSSRGQIVIDLWVTAIGASGTVVATPMMMNYADSTAGNGEAALRTLFAVGSQTIDLTAAQAIDVTWQWGTASASNLINVGATTITIVR